ncbi:MAG: DEAD/DEAH box helicase [Spirochaetaceae bacterium]|jgi:ATP-dependent RNA helicase RhlB|nr:DEAD/DEAH box helicase [Spirochaetaceae bacterium]
MDFNELELDENLAKGIAEAGYITCTPVQEQVLSAALGGVDLYVQSQTGTGKTAAYLTTILQRLAGDSALSGKKALVMVPTRELAVQVEQEAKLLGKYMPFKMASFYGGVGYTQQNAQLREGVDLIIGTPGRVIDLQQSGTMDMKEVAFLVIDEADRMFDMGFYPDLRKLIKVLPKAENRQTMLFSATLNNWVKNLAWEYTIEAKEITIESDQVTVEEIDQIIYHVSSEKKMSFLLGILAREKPESVIVFCNTKRMSEVVAKRLKINGFETEFIIGDLPQAKRLQVIESFKRGSLSCLVATDVAARGIDVNDLAMVVNYDLPNEAENYVHRIGRTARAGKTGKAYSLCSEQDVYNLPAIEKYIEAQIPSEIVFDDMLAEDKSAGMHIRINRYEDDDGRRSDFRGRPPRGRTSGEPRQRSDIGRKPGRPAFEKGASGRSQDGSSGRQERRFDDTRKKPAPRSDRRPDSRRNDPRNRQADSTADMSQLSFDERMAVYKQKYAGSETARKPEGKPAGQAQNGLVPKGSNPRKNQRKDAPKGQNGERTAQKQSGQQRKPEQTSQNRPQQKRPPVNKKPENTAVPQQTPEKKGLFSKIKSLFGGKGTK